ncbi:galectin-4-like isoform X1 [Bactrocera tryoni]|uniref:galectin-4-like isoform X1 n=1 Tax=Bactrocera tryoni TaxID=59916 RepID=UPI001A95C3D0|nr:galectin-4-like isoform X1 [Bactrocera tryoni]
MAALAFCVCSALEQFCEFADAFVRFGLSASRSFQYLRAKRNQIEFRRNCRAIWLQELSNRHALSVRVVYEILRRVRIPLTSANYVDHTIELVKKDMHRRGIDFAAIEASAEAYEAIDNFAAQRRSLAGQDSTDGGHRDYDMVDNYDDIEVLSGDEIDSSFYDYVEPLPVYQNEKIGTLKEGISFTVTGSILLNCERFSINFVIENPTRDVALHINPRLPQNYIVRNTKVKGVWGKEEVSSALPFSLHRGSKFAIQIFITDSDYLISVNGVHFAKYAHRLPYTTVSTIEVKGDVEDVSMERDEVECYPEHIPGFNPKEIRTALDIFDEQPNGDKTALMPYDEVDSSNLDWAPLGIKSSIALMKNIACGIPLPYYGLLPPDSLKVGRCLQIVGRVKLLPQSFYINLQKGQHYWPHPIIAFHFNPRFSKQSGAIGKAIVCRNAWYNGAWADEERSELDTDFRPGKTFRLAIVCAENAFEVYLNEKLITDFRYRIKPDVVDTVYIQGDIKLRSVVLLTNLSPKGTRRIYTNPLFRY